MTAPDVARVVAAHGTGQPESQAVRDLDRQLSYRELGDEVESVASGLFRHGVAAGDRVALHLPNSVDFVVAALACLRVGAVFVPLAVSDPEARVDAVVADCGPTVVVTRDEADGDDRSARRGPAPWLPFHRLHEPDTRPAPPHLDPDPDRPAYAIYTSGTTGTPKGVLIGSRAFGAAVRSTAGALGLSRDTRTLCVSPFYFDGSFGTLFPTLLVGGTVVIRPRESLLFPRTFFKAVLGERITYTGFSPSYLKLLLASKQIDTLGQGTLEVVALGGEAGSLSDIRSLRRHAPDLRIFNRYGPTEATIAVTHLELTPELLDDRVVPLGAPHPGVTFHLVDQGGRPVDGDGVVGELYIGGSQLMAGYWGAEDLTRSVLRSDVVPGRTVYRTGDLVYRDGRGHYVYVDRADRVVKRSGVRISLLELADALQRLPGVSGAACVVFDHEGEVGIAGFVVSDRARSVTELRADARGFLPDTMLPDRIEEVDSLPLTAAGKLDERRLLAAAGLPGRSVARPAAAGVGTA
jgi:D-alanine--poly(phosphoribitol) ligase subunit 1